MRKPVAQASLSRLALLVPAACLALGAAPALGRSLQRVQFLAFERFPSYKKSNSTGKIVLTSPRIRTHVRFDELIASWNVQLPPAATIEIQARAFYPKTRNTPEVVTKFYTMGIWSGNRALAPRESVPDQKDAIGDVSTDILRLVTPSDRLQLRLILTGEDARKTKVKFLGVCLADTGIEPVILPPNTNAWGKLIPVPERSQMKYENGNVLCSPASLSMLLAYWAEQLHQPELDRDVPEVAAEVYDPHWEGTGNWPFNTAYAGSFEPLRGYVTRLSLTELEDWIAKGIPVALSVCYNRLRGKSGPYSGHLVVCVGFTRDGDPIINDPGTSRNVRKTFIRENLITAWAYSKNTVYLVYPEKLKLPKDRFGHWDSSKGRKFSTE